MSFWEGVPTRRKSLFMSMALTNRPQRGREEEVLFCFFFFFHEKGVCKKGEEGKACLQPVVMPPRCAFRPPAAARSA